MRRWRSDDAAALQSAAATTPDLDHQVGGADLTTAAACRDFIERVLGLNRADVHNFAVVVDDQPVGNVGLSDIDRRHDTGWVHSWVAASHRRRGLATRGLATLAHWAFVDVGLYRLEVGHRVNNPGSCVVATRAGFASEGFQRAKLRYGDERFDVELHARLRVDPTSQVPVLPLDTG